MSKVAKSTVYSLKRERTKEDRDFYISLLDKDNGRRVSVGNFWGSNDQHAIERAIHAYPGLFNRMETNKWLAQASEIFERGADVR